MNILNLSDMKLARRLTIGFGSLTLLAVGIAGVAWWGVTVVNRTMAVALEKSAQSAATQEIDNALDNISLHMWNISMQKEMAQKQEHKAELLKLRESYKANLEHLKAIATTETEKQLLERISATVVPWREHNNRAMDLAFNGKEAEAAALCGGETLELGNKLNQCVAELLAFHAKQQSEATASAETMISKVHGIVVASSLAAVVLALIFGFLMTTSISRPIATGVALLDRISKGDLTQDVPAALRVRKDEAGDLARALETVTASLRTLLREISGGVHTLASSSTELSAISSQSSNGVKAMSEKASTVAAAAEEMSSNSVSVAAGMEEATTNLTTVASATEEMTSTIGEIAANSEKARTITGEATQQAKRVTELMEELSKAAQAIGHVTETITTISDQTKLLALNATIEAARAGAAGKGFAVVAHEIKELARQTADATEDIKSKVSGIQSSTTGTLGDLARISQVIGQVSEIVNTIATAIEEQSTVTKDIAANVGQAATGVKDANHRVAQISTVSQSIAKDIATVGQTAGDIAAGSEQVLTSSTELSRLSEELQEIVGRFKLNEQADLATGAQEKSSTGRKNSLLAGLATGNGNGRARAHRQLAA